MHKKDFIDYIDFLKYADENCKNLKNINFHNGRLYSYSTPSFRCKYLCKTDVIQPNKFVNMLGFGNYSNFVVKKFSKLKEFGLSDYKKWYLGYFGGLIGINQKIVNNFLGTGEVNTFYDYDINQAYLHGLTGFLPTKFIECLTPENYLKLNEFDKIPYIYFFEIELDFVQGEYLKAIGKIRGSYLPFDFLNSKQGKNIIVSEKRLSLINQIYFKSCYKIKKVFVFKREKFKFYENILNEYVKKKNDCGQEFKQNALRLYGTLGQIFKYKCASLKFLKKEDCAGSHEGDLRVFYKKSVNPNCSPQVAMWVADTVAEKIFDIISLNFDKIISWNTDGITSIAPLNLRLSKKPGYWKLKKIKGIPLLLHESGSRLIFVDIFSNEIAGGAAVTKENNDFYENVEISFSNLYKGYVVLKKRYKLDKFLTFNHAEILRNQLNREVFRTKILREKDRFYEKYGYRRYAENE